MLDKLTCFLTFCAYMLHVTPLHDCPNVFIHAYLKCQLFTADISHSLPKCLNYCFSVLACAAD